jgi:hypothetical protein
VRAALRWLILSLLGGVAIMAVAVATVFLQTSYLEPHPGYRAFVEAAARIGPRVTIVAAVILVLDLAALVTIMILRGQTDRATGAVVDDGPMAMGLGPRFGRSKRKILVSKSGFVTVESLVEGTATLAERLLVVGIFVLFASFFLVFVGVALMILQEWAVAAVLFVAVPGFFVFSRLIGPAWEKYREVKARVRAGGSA